MTRINYLFLILALSFPSGSVLAQVLTTGETLGRGAQAVMLSENHLFVDGVDLNNGYLQYVRGLSGRFDLYVSVGTTHLMRRDQEWVGAGGNLHLFRVRKFAVSWYNVCSLPVNHTTEASTVLLNSALVVSREVNKTITLYSGVNSLLPIGARDRGFFTPMQREFNVPVGAAIFHGKWAVFLEGDIGHLKMAGVGISRSL